MKRPLWLAFVLIGCGTPADLNLQNGVAPLTGSTLSGTVTSEAGLAQPGVRVVAHERTSNFKATGISAQDGTFSLEVEPGVYDLGLDKQGDALTATCFYGPIDAGARPQTFVLKNSNGRQPQNIFGKIWLQPGTPAGQRLITLRPGHGRETTPQQNPPISLNTNNDGTFEASLGSQDETGLDLEIYTGPQVLEQFVDIGKLAKPCYVEMATQQSPVHNRLRCNQSEAALSGSLKGVAASPDPTFALFTFSSNPQPASITLSDGLLPVDATTRRFVDITPPLPGPFQGNLLNLSTVLQFGKIMVAKNGSWFWTYAVNLDLSLPADTSQEIRQLVDTPTTWKFTDQTQDTYKLNVIYGTTGQHKVSYNSAKPAINKLYLEPF